MRHSTRLFVRDDDDVNCGSGGGDQSLTGLRIASVFIVLIGSLSGALFPVLARRTKWLAPLIPEKVFDTAKYFGSGVIIATALIHLLDPAIDELTSPCLNPAWQDYPYALGICLLSIFSIFIVEVVAFRWGTARLARMGIVSEGDDHGHFSTNATHASDAEKTSAGEEGYLKEEGRSAYAKTADLEARKEVVTKDIGDSAAAQILGIAILEFGVLLHSILIGLTLAVDDQFKILFVVIIFHQTFEGLGVGSRLAYLRLPPGYNYVAIVGAVLYGITTPLGIAVGLGVRSTYNPDSTTASIVSGLLDAFSSGILLYTGLVELLAHEFLFNREMQNASNGKLAYAIVCVVFGAGIMALLGRWA